VINNLPLGHLKIAPGDLRSFIAFVDNSIRNQQKTYCVPLNLTKYVVSKKDPKLKKVIRAAGFVIADGIPICWLSKRLGYKGVRRITGIELAEALLAHSMSRGWRIFLLGSSAADVDLAIRYVKEKFGQPLIVGFHHGYFTDGEVNLLLAKINTLKPDILLLGLGMPQKEYFIDDYFDHLKASFLLPVGGAFDIWAQTKKRSNALIQKLGLEWLQRSIYNSSKARNILRYSFDFFKDYLFYR